MGISVCTYRQSSSLRLADLTVGIPAGAHADGLPWCEGVHAGVRRCSQEGRSQISASQRS